ncbi:MAG: efflux RND transporter permease subunit, partial [Bacteroidales bacterium]|jgi:HAE1 family hydrophobic/amphiphilic exporter-1|nr:efflux RND transporter permease subunit [Bacteroidales bacterium]
LNIISLSALSLAIGMVVDDSIVVLENISTHIERGSNPRQSAIFATKEVMTSVIASCLTMLSVFIPLTMISGLSGVLFKQLGWIVAIIMVMSATAALTLIPMMSSKLLKLDQKKGKLYTLFFTPVEKALSALNNGYARLLSWAVHHRKSVIGIVVALFAGVVIFLAPAIKSEFFPSMDNARLSVTAELPVGTRQGITREVALRINDELYDKYPEIKYVTYTLGQAADDNIIGNMSDNGAHIISYTISLVGKEERDRGQTEIAELVRQDLATYAELADYEVSAGLMGVGGEASVDIEIYGFDFNVTDRIAADVAGHLQESPYCSQVTVSRGDYIPEIQVDFDREKLALHGLNVTTAAGYLRNSVNGSVASYYREDGEEYDIRVRLAPEYRETIESIENITVYDAFGKGVRIRDLGTVVEEMTPPTIERKNRERVITVTGIVSQDAALSDLVGDVQQFMPQIEMPQNVTWQIAGSFEDQQDTFSDIATLLVLIIILIYIVMASQFESMVDPFVIMLALPFAFIGVVLGLSITGTPLGLMGMIGILIIVGVVAKNGIVLIDYIRLCREKGMGIINAVVTAGKSRLRPVLMTTLTTVLGMLPMALGNGEGAEMWNAMGITVAWGVSIGTLVTLVLVPVIYCIFAGRGVKRQRRENAKMEVLEILATD